MTIYAGPPSAAVPASVKVSGLVEDGLVRLYFVVDTANPWWNAKAEELSAELLKEIQDKGPRRRRRDAPHRIHRHDPQAPLGRVDRTQLGAVVLALARMKPLSLWERGRGDGAPTCRDGG